MKKKGYRSYTINIYANTHQNSDEIKIPTKKNLPKLTWGDTEKKWLP